MSAQDLDKLRQANEGLDRIGQMLETVKQSLIRQDRMLAELELDQDRPPSIYMDNDHPENSGPL